MNKKLTWSLQTIPVSKLEEWKDNPRKISAEDLENLKQSFIEFDQARTITVSPLGKKFEIIGGNQTKKILIELQYSEIQCSVASRPLTETEKRKLSIYLNHRNKGEGEWDFDVLTGWDDVDFEDIGIDFPPMTDDFGTDFTLPEGGKTPFQQMTFTLADAQAEKIKESIKKVKVQDGTQYGNENSNGNALHQIVLEWAEQRT